MPVAAIERQLNEHPGLQSNVIREMPSSLGPSREVITSPGEHPLAVRVLAAKYQDGYQVIRHSDDGHGRAVCGCENADGILYTCEAWNWSYSICNCEDMLWRLRVCKHMVLVAFHEVRAIWSARTGYATFPVWTAKKGMSEAERLSAFAEAVQMMDTRMCPKCASPAISVPTVIPQTKRSALPERTCPFLTCRNGCLRPFRVEVL